MRNREVAGGRKVEGSFQRWRKGPHLFSVRAARLKCRTSWCKGSGFFSSTSSSSSSCSPAFWGEEWDFGEGLCSSLPSPPSPFWAGCFSLSSHLAPSLASAQARRPLSHTPQCEGLPLEVCNGQPRHGTQSSLPPHSQAVPSSLKDHLSCGPQNCGLRSGSMWPCSSPGTCYMPGACKGRVWGQVGPSPLHTASDFPRICLPPPFLKTPSGWHSILPPPQPLLSHGPISSPPPWGSYVGRLYRGVMRKQATTALRRCLDKSLCHTAFLDL